MTLTTPTQLNVERVRHAIKARLLQVRQISQLTPRMVRVTFHGPDLGDFISASFDDHMKLFFPQDGKLVLPEKTPEGIRFPADAPRPPARDYTPRRYRPADNELDIDFVLHGEGPAATWVANAQVGDSLAVAGPRGSFVIPQGFDWQLLIGDETALPAIGRRLEEMAPGAQVHVIALVEDATEEQVFQTQADLHITWLHRKQGKQSQVQSKEQSPSQAQPQTHEQRQSQVQSQPLVDAVHRFAFPAGEGFIWGGGEAAQMRAITQFLLDEKGIDKSRVRVSNYWKQGSAQE